jgi:single-stranded-DNA-specific exonuclease
MVTWLEPEDIAISPELLEAAGSPLAAELLARRGVAGPAAAAAFLDPARYTPCPPGELPGLDRAAARLRQAIQAQEPVCVWGDFDVDGQTAATLLVATLRELGAQVSYHIPVRERESHGVNLVGLQQVIAAGARLVLTCDTGITAHAAAEHARQAGVDFLITDHHALPEQLPEAYAVVNPRLLPAGHPLGMLPGVGVAYKLAEALFARFDRPGAAEEHLDLAALGIIADLAELTGETRYLAQRGLQALRQPERLGLQIMYELAELNPAGLNETHIGFTLGPRLNALGRLGDANPIVELLTTRDPGRARLLATQLEGLNAQRKLLTSQVFQAAQAQLERDPALLEAPVIIVTHPDWPGGVLGIVAARLVERYRRPALVLAAQPEGLARGSARSIAGVNITAAIAAQAHLLTNYGGHPMAAGLALPTEKLPAFRKALGRAVQAQLGAAPPEPPLALDAYLDLAELTPALVTDLERLAPFGPGNPAPILAARDLKKVSASTLGRTAEHVQVIVADAQSNTYKALWWGGAGAALPEGRFDLAYTARLSTFRGEVQVQVEWLAARPRPGAPGEVASEPAPERTLFDYRQAAHPLAVLQQLQAEPEPLQVWCEGPARQKLAEAGIVGLATRLELAPSARLAIWTPPPGPQVLAQALVQANPQTVYLFNVDPEMDRPEPFLARLAGLVKYALKQTAGQVTLAALAAATAQRPSAVRLGVSWLAAAGHLVIAVEAGETLTLSAGGAPDPARQRLLGEQLAAALAESAAYRGYYARMAPELS